MKKNISHALIFILSSSAAAHAAGPEFNFDGRNSAAPLLTRDSAFSALKSAELRFPGANKWGDIPEVPPPTPVDPLPGGGHPPPQNPNPPQNPVPHPNPPANPQPNPGPAPTPVVPPDPSVPWVQPPSADFYQRPFQASMCLASGLGSADCRNGSGLEASVKLAMNMREDILQDMGGKAVVFVFPATAGPAALYSALRTALTYGIDQLAIGMQEDLSRMMKEMDSPGWGTPYDKARMMRMVVQDEKSLRTWKTAALGEAAQGINWKKSGKNGYKFNGGPAYDQLRNSLLLKEIFTGQRKLFSPDTAVR